MLTGNFLRDTLLSQSRDNQVGETDGRRACSQKQDSLILELATCDLQGIDQSGESYAGRTLDVVVVAGNLIAVAGKQSDRVDPGPVFEMDAAIWKQFLNRIHKLVHERIEFLARGTMLPQTDVERIFQILFVVRASIQVHRQQPLRRHARGSGVQLQLPDRDTHAVGAQIPKTEDASGIGHTDETHILHRPVA